MEKLQKELYDIIVELNQVCYEKSLDCHLNYEIEETPSDQHKSEIYLKNNTVNLTLRGNVDPEFIKECQKFLKNFR